MDRKEFEHIALKIRPKLMASAISLTGNETDAEDAVQDTLLKMWTIRDRLGTYRSPEALGMVMTRNFCLDRMRKLGTLPVSPIDSEVKATNVETQSAEEMMIGRENIRQLNDILRRLPEHQRRMLCMRHQEDMEISEIAAATGNTEGNVRTILSRARTRVKELFLNYK